MNRAQIILDNARAELELAILSGNTDSEIELRNTIVEMIEQIKKQIA